MRINLELRPSALVQLAEEVSFLNSQRAYAAARALRACITALSAEHPLDAGYRENIVEQARRALTGLGGVSL